MSLLSADAQQALALSLRVAGVGIAAGLPFAVALAWLLSRRRFPLKVLVETLVYLPLVLPPVVTGYGLLRVFGHAGPLGRVLDALGIGVAFRWTGAAIAAAVMGLPLLVVSLRTAFDQVDRRYEQAAATLGAPPWRIFAGVTLPLAMRGLIAGCVLAFARAFGEFGATITFVSSIPGQSRTLPVAIYEFLNVPGGEADAARLVWVAVAVAFAATLGAALLQRGGRRP